MVFYLKVNRNNSYVLPNLKHWLDAVMMYEGSYAYILCDNSELKSRILSELKIDNARMSFLESDRNNDEINRVLNNICRVNKWVKVGQAHLKTHWHADESKYDSFWNIDADDTFICLDPIRMVELFKKVEDYCRASGIRMISLDMWRTMSINEKWPKGDNWSLGVVYVDNSVSWKDILLEHCTDSEYGSMTFPFDKDINLDWYFTYLRRQRVERIETFYFENLRFMHFFDYFFNFPHLSTFCFWKQGKLHYPILESCFGSKFRSELPIAPDAIRFDIGITEDEALLALAACSGEVFSFWRDIRDSRLDVGDLMKKRCELFLEEIGKKQIVCWGAGTAFHRNYELLKKAYELKYICDSDESKWGKEIEKGVICISPDDLGKQCDDVFVLVMIDSPSVNHKIIHKLLELNITSFDHFDNWIEIVTGMNV